MAKPTMTIQLVGERELQKLFKELPDKIKPNVVKRIARKAASPIRARARQLVPVGPTGNLRKSIKIGISRFPRNVKRSGVWVGPNYSRGKHRGPHGHLVAFGSKERYHKSGKSTGRAMANKPPIGDFIKQAADQTRSEVLGNMTKDLKKVIDSEMTKLSKRASRRRIKF